MPYFIYIITTKESTNSRSLDYVVEFGDFRTAKKEIKRLRAESPLPDNRNYKIIFAPERVEAEKSLLEHREEPIAREWEK